MLSDLSLDVEVLGQHRRHELGVEGLAVPSPLNRVVLEDEYPVEVRAMHRADEPTQRTTQYTLHSQLNHHGLWPVRIDPRPLLEYIASRLVRAQNDDLLPEHLQVYNVACATIASVNIGVR